MKPETALEWIENFEEFTCLPLDSGLVKTAAYISERFRISYWDGAIIAAAEALGASTLYTEDLNHGRTYGAVKVINPFFDPKLRTGFHDNAQAPLAKD
jgi:predicted nucleic acid-binding protein